MCAPCPRGYFAADKHSTACTPCPAGTAGKADGGDHTSAVAQCGLSPAEVAHMSTAWSDNMAAAQRAMGAALLVTDLGFGHGASHARRWPSLSVAVEINTRYSHHVERPALTEASPQLPWSCRRHRNHSPSNAVLAS